MTAPDEEWFDEAAGPLVRPYAMTGGRTRSDTLGLDLITLVVASHTATDVDVEPEYAGILSACKNPTSVVEVAAKVDLPLQVVKVLMSDLITQRLIIFRSPATQGAEPPSQYVLQAVLDGIRKL
ncbi:MAG: DUF742 domain-containing protein [Actinophytocola sp.]|uniref:DUF742 domain-containing protein n=1 Tax=Actinophytocola sp. TaxID=1872138 RepID=UPI003C782D49